MQKALPAIILLAHGSRDPLWRAPIEAIAANVAAQVPARQVACAYLELSAPTLQEAAHQLINAGAEEIAITPLFLGMGKHAREDLPRLVADLRALYPGVQFGVKPAVGEDHRVVELLARLAAEPHGDRCFGA